MTYKMNITEFTNLLNEIGYQDWSRKNGIWFEITQSAHNLDLNKKIYENKNNIYYTKDGMTNWDFINNSSIRMVEHAHLLPKQWHFETKQESKEYRGGI